MVRSLTTGVGAHQAAPRQPTPGLAIKHGTRSFSTLSFEAQHPGVSPSPRKQTQDHAIATCREGPIVVIVCMDSSSESWEPQQRPHPWHSVPVEEVAVGTEITLRPPHRTRRALLTHRAPTLDGDEEPLLRPRMQDAWERQVTISDRLHSGPR